jgi:hypothetical protein
MRICTDSRAVTSTAVLGLAMAVVVSMSAIAQDVDINSPPDTTHYFRPVIPEDFNPVVIPPVIPENFNSLETSSKSTSGQSAPFDLLVVDTVVNNTDANLTNTDTAGDQETSIAINPQQLNEIVITAFSGPPPSSGAATPLWLSRNGGNIWSKVFTINPPPGITTNWGSDCGGNPCDQTVDFSRSGGDFGQRSALAGTFLTSSPDNVYSALIRNPAGPAFNYFQNSPGVAQATNHLDGINRADQPWLLTGPRPADGTSFRENVYVAYDDFNTAPDMHVAVAGIPIPTVNPLLGANPLNFTVDNISGFSTGSINPGHRLAVDPSSGAVYSLFQRNIAAGHDGSKNIDYMLNRSTDGGITWILNGSTTGIRVANADSTQPVPKFCTVNALLGGVVHAAVDPQTGDVVYVYGNRDPNTRNNRLAMRLLTDDGAGGLAIGPEIFVTGQVQAAIPSVAVTENGTIGVFYYTCDGFSTTITCTTDTSTGPVNYSGPAPIFTAHFAVSTDRGANFIDMVLETFLAPCPDSLIGRQRELGDYVQVKAVEDVFFGSFSGNGALFGRTIANNDPIFYTVSARP